jgi:hypothetical protein
MPSLGFLGRRLRTQVDYTLHFLLPTRSAQLIARGFSENNQCLDPSSIETV